MTKLSREAFERAQRFLKAAARPLEIALFEHHFKDAPVELVTAELAKFQNPDGGFGQALEPDMRTPTSSALATGIGLTLLAELGCPAEHPLVRPAVDYLQATLDSQTQVWRVIPTDANDFPHAPWWHDADGSLARTFDDFLIIPRAQLVGSLHHYAQLLPAAWLDKLTESAVSAVESIEVFGSGGGDDLSYALQLAETAALPEYFRQRLLDRIRKVVPAAVSRDPEEWSSYCIHPLKIVHSAQSPVLDLLEAEVERNLDYLIETQTAEGSWDPVWSWGDAYPDQWEQAKLEWRGHLTLHNLLILRDFGRLA